ncbi:MAG: hypothetical protein WCS88_02170 [Patescibacteria group bacterium]|jgi:hypothetical protein
MKFFAGMDFQAIAIIFGLLALFVLVAIKTKRPLKYNGQQERLKKPPLHIFTLNSGEGTSFASKNKRVLGRSEVSSRRKKFGQSVASALLWFIGLATAIFFASRFV